MRLGGYEVIGPIGAGGMGEVFRARDTTLNRDVAIKLVHSSFCDNPDSLNRLRREARVLASINHPNVATLHELAEFGDGCGLVMELVSGETLADLIRQRPFSVADTLRLGAQVAAALEAAHERGLVHRDLKPANIKVTSDGHAKVLDFGLAKADAGGPEASDAPTFMTEQGVIVGTAPYMSPEQARGAPVDRRTDLWAFGCVLFEMLTGRRAFHGPSNSDILVGILERDPDFSSLPPNTPPPLERLIRRCLTKDSRRRYRDAGDARLELEDAAITPTGITPPKVPAVPARDRMRIAVVFALGALLGGVMAAGWWRRPAGPAPRQVQFAVTLSDDERLAATDLGEIAVSPDGRNVVYVAARGSATQLSIRSLEWAQSTPLRGTLNAVTPFFSPDGEWIGFFADGKLKKVAVGGGTPVPLCDAADGLGGSWSASGTIVFASATGSPLQRVAESGGTPSRATELDVSRGEFSHRWPSFLPDGTTFLFSVGTVGDWDEAEIFAQALDGEKPTLVLKGGTNARYLDAGYLSYGHKGAIWIVPFDAKRLKLTGTPQKVLEGVAVSADGAAQFSVSRNATGVYVPANLSSSARRLVVVQDGEQTPLAAPAHAYVTPRLSPDGRRVVLGVSEATEHIVLYELNSAALTPLTLEAANRAPIWWGDGRVTFASNRNGALNLFSAPPDGNGTVEGLLTSDYLQMPGSWSRDGQTLALMEQNPTTGRDIWLWRSGERTAFANSTADESAARFSPDGLWIAYVSNESGQAEVWVRPATGAAPARKVGSSGGMEPVWSRDGGALFYRANGRLMMVPMSGGVSTAAPRVAFDGKAEAGTFDAAGYEVMPGANRFLIITGASPASTASQLRVILNWAPGTPTR
jgi:Tol biopolymer transport system component